MLRGLDILKRLFYQTKRSDVTTNVQFKNETHGHEFYCGRRAGLAGPDAATASPSVFIEMETKHRSETAGYKIIMARASRTYTKCNHFRQRHQTPSSPDWCRERLIYFGAKNLRCGRRQKVIFPMEASCAIPAKGVNTTTTLNSIAQCDQPPAPGGKSHPFDRRRLGCRQRKNRCSRQPPLPATRHSSPIRPQNDISPGGTGTLTLSPAANDDNSDIAHRTVNAGRPERQLHFHHALPSPCPPQSRPAPSCRAGRI